MSLLRLYTRFCCRCRNRRRLVTKALSRGLSNSVVSEQAGRPKVLVYCCTILCRRLRVKSLCFRNAYVLWQAVLLLVFGAFSTLCQPSCASRCLKKRTGTYVVYALTDESIVIFVISSFHRITCGGRDAFEIFQYAEEATPLGCWADRRGNRLFASPPTVSDSNTPEVTECATMILPYCTQIT